MPAIFKEENRDKLRHLLSIMLPIIGTQIAIIGMNFFDASMSGQAGDADLAGAAIGGNVWMPVQTGISGILMGAMPLAANYLGAGSREKLRLVIRHGLAIAFCFALLVLAGGAVFLPPGLARLGLEPEVYSIAVLYCAGIGLGVLPFFMITPLRCFVDTMGYTRLTMKIYLMALPINACLNYILIFGRLGLPRMGGSGAGIATGLTFWLLFFMYAWVVTKLAPFREFNVLGIIKPQLSAVMSYLRIGVPMGVSIFLETSIFGVVAFFVAKFGTEVIAAHQAALNFSSLIYMIPLSFSLSLTIVTGVEYGAGRYSGARLYTKLGLELSMLLAAFYMTAEYFARGVIAQIYSSNSQVIELTKHFILYAIIWQAGDTIAAPIQGILRGYKDVDATFWTSMLAYWGICLPVGLLLDYRLNHGAFAYWQSLDFGVASSAVLLSLRLLWLQRKLDKEKSAFQNIEKG